MKKLLFALMLIGLTTALAFGLPSVEHICASWDAHPDAASYTLYWRTVGGSFNDTNSYDVGTATEIDITATIPSIAEGTYEWSVTFTRANGSESDFCSPILHELYRSAQDKVTNFQVQPCQ